MKIEIYSDFACPFCYIGKRNLQAALEQFEGKNNVEVVYKAFELYRDLDVGFVGLSTQKRIEKKYRKSEAEAMEMIRGIEYMAKRAGIDMNYERVQNSLTFDAHRLQKFARENGYGEAASEAIFKAYFIENSMLSEHENLAKIAKQIGLDESQTLEMLNSDRYGQEVRDDEEKAYKMGIFSVPFFIIGDKFSISGAQGVPAMLEVIKRANNTHS